MDHTKRKEYEQQADTFLQIAYTPGLPEVERAAALIHAGMAKMALQCPEQSAELFEQAIALRGISHRDEYACTIKLIECYSHMRDKRLIVEICNRAINRFPEVSVEWLFFRAEPRSSLEGNNAGIEDLNLALKLAEGTSYELINLIQTYRIRWMMTKAIERNDLRLIREASSSARKLAECKQANKQIKTYALLMNEMINCVSLNFINGDILNELQKERRTIGFTALRMGFTFAYKKRAFDELCRICDCLFRFHLVECKTVLGRMPSTKLLVNAHSVILQDEGLPIRKKSLGNSRVLDLCETAILFAVACHERNEEGIANMIWEKVLCTEDDKVPDDFRLWCSELLMAGEAGKSTLRELWGRFFLDTSALEKTVEQ